MVIIVYKTRNQLNKKSVMKETAPTQRTTGSDNNKKKNNEEKVKKPRPSASRLADEILLMVKKSRDPYNPDNARIGRALLGQFLKELTAEKNHAGKRIKEGNHTQIALSIQVALKEKRTAFLKKENALILAQAAIRNDVAFGRLVTTK